MLRIYTLVLAGMLGLGVAGCGSGGSEDGYFDAAWSLAYASDGVAATCAGTGTTEVHLDVQESHTSEVYHDTFACAAYGGTTASLPVGDYIVTLRAYDNFHTASVSEVDFPDTYPIHAGEVTTLPGVTLEY